MGGGVGGRGPGPESIYAHLRDAKIEHTLQQTKWQSKHASLDQPTTGLHDCLSAITDHTMKRTPC